MQLEETPEACAVVRRRARELGNVFYGIAASCRAQAPSAYVDAGLPVLDESSPAALALSTVALLNSRVPMSIDEERRLATKLDELRSHEASKLGRAVLADASGALWEFANKPDRANAALLTAAREDPLHLESWQQLVLAAADTGSTSSGASVAAAWFPAEAMFLQRTSSIRSDELDLRLHDTRLAYFLEPNLLHARQLGRALAEAGHDEEARAIATMHAGSPDPSPALESYVLAFVDLHSARLLRGLERLREAEDARMSDLVVVASVLDRSDELATKWATEFLAKPDDVVRDTIRGYVGPIVLCMRARSDLATRCLDRVSRVGHASRNWWGQGGDALLKGAQRYALGDPRGAVALWRPLIAAPSEEIARILPTEAFERAGEPELAARLDARKMHYTLIAGVSDAALREAKRALAAGDKTRAKDLAQKVITAWEVADVSVPAVAEMRALLKSLNR